MSEKPSQHQIRALLARLSKARAACSTALLQLSEVTTARDKHAAEIEKAGDPDWRNDVAVEKRAVKEAKLKIMERVIPVVEQRLQEAIAELRIQLLHLCGFCQELFSAPYEARMAQVAECLLAVYDDPNTARRAAPSTDAGRSARILAFDRWNLALNLGHCTDFALLDRYSHEFSTVLTEASRDNPDLVSMLSFRKPAAESAKSKPETVPPSTPQAADVA